MGHIRRELHGIADARGLVAALCLGADGVVMGTRFLATPEANAHATYKDKLVAASEEHTVRTILEGGKDSGKKHTDPRLSTVRDTYSISSKLQLLPSVQNTRAPCGDPLQHLQPGGPGVF